MTLLIKTFDTSLKLLSCGIDCEKIDRFKKWTKDSKNEPPEFIFTRREVLHVRNLENPAFGLCASFCIKEAFLKATQQQYDFRECEFFLKPDYESEAGTVVISNYLRKKFNIEKASVFLIRLQDSEEHLIATLFLFGK